MTKSKTPIMDLETDEDGWIGGSSQSIYAPKSQPATDTHASPPPASKSNTKRSPVTPARQKNPTSSDSNPRSLLERIDMAQTLQTPPPKPRPGQASADASTSSASPSPAATSPFRTTPSQGIRRPGAKIPSPLPLTSPARNNPPASPHNTRTPLSASHPIPETPLKLSQRGGPQTPATPHYPAYQHSSHTPSDGDNSRASGLGLGLTPLKGSVPLAPSPDAMRSPLNDAVHLRGRAASNASIGSPLKQGRTDLHGEPLALGSSFAKSAAQGNGQIDAMLDRLRSTRSGLGTSASMWAPKPASTATSSDTTASTSSTTSHTIGSGFSSSNLLGVQTGLDRKRPGHRPNGLQLSLGQEISVMQELEEKAEEDYAPSTLSSATVGETFKIDPPQDDADATGNDGWYGSVVPPTPVLGCDSPSSDDDNADSKPPSRSLDAFGWGTHSRNPSKGSLFSNLPSSSTLEANWSGDDDDDRKDDVEVFEDMQRAAKAASKDKRSHHSPLPPPPINFAKSRTPSPTHRVLAKSPQLDASPALSAADKLPSQRLSPASARSQLPALESDGDADAETDKPRGGKEERKPAKKPVVALPESATESAPASGGLEKKRSLKRDKSERIRGRRSSSSKEKDVDHVKMTAANASASTKTDASADELVKGIATVDLHANVRGSTPSKPDVASTSTVKQPTPVAQRVQSIPEVKNDLFSSPAVPKVGLPSAAAKEPAHVDVETKTEAGADSTQAAETASEASAKVEEATTPAPSHIDWAEDDDEDELPDLDDWGVTLTPAKPAPASEPKPAASKDAGRGSKPPKKDEPTWRRAEPPRGKPKPTPKAEGGPLGMRIAGRAKEASLSPEPPSRGKKASPAQRSEEMPPPAATPYGRWKQPAAPKDKAAGRPRIAADLGALAKLIAPDEAVKPPPPPGGGRDAKKDEAGAKKVEAVKTPSVADSMHAPKPRSQPSQGAAKKKHAAKK
ncbi:hypothetical protein PaG_04824 [Moesziomyces aphidis]|uniref:Uncharacterized protein n=1 Tax=Moesziomyces aphidis TaxID=84754 RepID=W3VH60_MOEAP|nr:hypothetical protein PaG_04824 [Moesziomyces aphidis]